MDNKNKYVKLISNTIIFAIGTFSSKLLTFFILPFVTSIIPPDGYTVINAIVDNSLLVIPLVSAGISAAIIRFGLDKSIDKRDVFTSGIIVLLFGYLLFLPFYKLIGNIPYIGEYTYLVYIYVLASCMRSLCSQFVRARGLVRLYAFDGIFSTITIIIGMYIFLVVFKLGVLGYILATIVSDFLSAAFLFFSAKLYRYIRFRGFHGSVCRRMLLYSVPLIPNSISWWLTTAYGRQQVATVLGDQVGGVYGAAYRIPSAINMISGIFNDAWQMSAFTEEKSGRDRFFSNVYNTYQSLIFIAASGLILCTKLIASILLRGEKYADAWKFIPFLVIATAFSCLVSQLGSIYMTEKRSFATLVTTALGAGISVALCHLLIPAGANGAAAATLIGNFVVFLVRAVHTRRYIKINWYLGRTVFSILILFAQALVMLTVPTFWIPLEIMMCLLVVLINLRQILMNLHTLLPGRKRRG